MAPRSMAEEEVSIVNAYQSSSINESGQRTRQRHPYVINLNANFEARIRNPLAGIPRPTLLSDIDEFVKEKGLEDYRELIRKGALIAQDPTGYEDIDGDEKLTQGEIDALRAEILHKWRCPASLYLTVITCSIGAAVQGWDQTGSNGANLEFPQIYGIDSSSILDKTLVGLVNAAPYIGTALVGSWLSDPINKHFGRRGTIFVAAHFCLWPVLASAFCDTWVKLLGCRLLLGVGMGCKAATVPIFAAESSPAPIRGAFVMSWQLWCAFGIFLGTCANIIAYKNFTEPWRYQLGSAFIPAVPLAMLIYFCPESPRWYIKKNRYRNALKSLLRLRNHPVQAARDLYNIHVQLQIEREFIGEGNYLVRFKELFTVPRIRRATLASWVVMIAQQMCGINIIAFYSTTVFSTAGSGKEEAYLSTLGFGLINFLFAFPALWTIDTFGRRSLLLFTFPQMAWTLLAAGLCAQFIPDGAKAQTVLVALFVYLFAAFYSPGEGPVPYTYSAEVFPLSHREVGMAWAVATCLFWAAVLSITFPLMLDRLGVFGSFGLYALFNVIALIMIFLWLPETKQRTLEELDYIFAVPTRVFMKYQITEALPWWVRRWVLFRRDAKLEPLYKLDFGNNRAEEEDGDDHRSRTMRGSGSGSSSGAGGLGFAYETDKARIELKDSVRLTTATTDRPDSAS